MMSNESVAWKMCSSGLDSFTQDVQYEKIAMDWVMEYQPEHYNVLMRRLPGGPWQPGKCRLRWLRLVIEPPFHPEPQHLDAFGLLASRERFLVMAGYAQVEFYSLVYWEFRLPGWCPRLRKAGGRKCLWPATRPTWWLHRLVLSLDSWNWHIFHPMRDDDLAWSQLIFIFLVFWGGWLSHQPVQVGRVVGSTWDNFDDRPDKSWMKKDRIFFWTWWKLSPGGGS